MFCCSVCNVMFTGVGNVVTTPCGHVFHSECILVCLNRFPKCPSCSLHVEKNKLIQLHFQIYANWKETAAFLRSEANTSVINLDETFDESMRIDEPVQFYSTSGITSPKTLLTTSLYGLSTLSPMMKSFLSVLNKMIPNSIVKIRSLVSGNSLLQTAINEGFTNILIINLQYGEPVGLTLMDLLVSKEVSVMLVSYKFLGYENNDNKMKALTVTKNYLPANDFQKYVVNFFSRICKTNSGRSVEEVSILCCDNPQVMELRYSLAGLSFRIRSTFNNTDI